MRQPPKNIHHAKRPFSRSEDEGKQRVRSRRGTRSPGDAAHPRAESTSCQGAAVRLCEGGFADLPSDIVFDTFEIELSDTSSSSTARISSSAIIPLFSDPTWDMDLTQIDEPPGCLAADEEAHLSICGSRGVRRYLMLACMHCINGTFWSVPIAEKFGNFWNSRRESCLRVWSGGEFAQWHTQTHRARCLALQRSGGRLPTPLLSQRWK